MEKPRDVLKKYYINLVKLAYYCQEFKIRPGWEHDKVWKLLDRHKDAIDQWTTIKKKNNTVRALFMNEVEVAKTWTFSNFDEEITFHPRMIFRNQKEMVFFAKCKGKKKSN